MTIQTILGHKREWTDCEHKDWDELLDDGWVFCSKDPKEIEENKPFGVLMYRNGYLNEFREI